MSGCHLRPFYNQSTIANLYWLSNDKGNRLPFGDLQELMKLRSIIQIKRFGDLAGETWILMITPSSATLPTVRRHLSHGTLRLLVSDKDTAKNVEITLFLVLSMVLGGTYVTLFESSILFCQHEFRFWLI